MSVSVTRTVKYIRKGDKGERGAVLRGPQMWDDVPVGYLFQAGEAGAQWKDVVIYNGQYYHCTASHVKTANNGPTSDTDLNNGLWQLGAQIALVATQILLAQYALVKNLGVESIDMRDADGNIIFQAKDGAVSCNKGEFNGITVGQSSRLGGFTIINDSLITPPYTKETSVCCRNDTHRMLSAIGSGINVSPASDPREAARFKNEDTAPNDNRNIAVRAVASSAKHNHALMGKGNITLQGACMPYLMSLATITASASDAIKIEQNNVWLINAPTAGAGVLLPSLSAVREALNAGSGNFCIRLTILADIGSKTFYVRGLGAAGATSDQPLITDWDGGTSKQIALENGDCEEFLLVCGPTRQIGSYSYSYTARRIHRQS